MSLALTLPIALTGSLFVASGPVMSGGPIPPASALPQRPRGYHTSPHIETYYSTLRY